MNIYSLVKELDIIPTGKTAEYLAKKYAVSIATFKNRVKNYNSITETQYGFKILGKSGRKNGYFIEIIDEVKYQKYLSGNVEYVSVDYNSQSNRIGYIIKNLIRTRDYIKLDDIAEELFISKTQLSRDIAVIREEIQKFDLKLEDKPYYGLKLIGDEFQLRLFITNTNILETDDLRNIINPQYSNEDIDSNISIIREILIKNSLDYNYELSDVTCHNLILHLLLSINRIDNQMEVELSNEMISSLIKEVEFPLAVAIVEDVEDKFDIKFNDDEVYYVIAHLSSKKIVDRDNFIVDPKIQDLIDEMLVAILKEFSFDFRGDLNLRIMLAMHLVPLINRLKYGTMIQNPLLDKIKKNLWFAYDLSLCVTNVINDKYNTSLSEDEISYFALHFEVALGEVNFDNKKNIILICSTGRGTAELLRQDFQRKFEGYINKLKTANVFELETIDYSEYDYIFSTVPINVHVPLPVFNISHFISVDMTENISEILNRDIRDFTRFCKKEYFFTNIKANTKEEVLKEIVGRLNEVVKIPGNFIDSVLEREVMSSTEFENRVAFPHPMMHMSDVSFISISVLDKPITWSEKKVQLIILSSFEKGFVKKHADVMNILTKLITSNELITKIIENPDYKTVLSVLN